MRCQIMKTIGNIKLNIGFLKAYSESYKQLQF